MDRRAFLRATARLAALAALGQVAGCVPAPPSKFDKDPFTLGVASGDPLPDGVVLWTRLAPNPLAGGGMGSASVEVEWLVARDDAMKDVVRSGTSSALADLAHSVHVEVVGLDPDRVYWYRFRAGGAESPIGRTRGVPVDRHVGRPRGGEQLRRRNRQGGPPEQGGDRRARRGLSGVLRAHAGPRSETAGSGPQAVPQRFLRRSRDVLRSRHPPVPLAGDRALPRDRPDAIGLLSRERRSEPHDARRGPAQLASEGARRIAVAVELRRAIRALRAAGLESRSREA